MRQMDKMPYEIKLKLRQLAKAYQKASDLENEVSKIIDIYGVDCKYLDSTCSEYTQYPFTDFAYITNSEGDIEDSIDEIEEVFLWHYNNNNNSDNKGGF